jgi:hypothetical protein
MRTTGILQPVEITHCAISVGLPRIELGLYEPESYVLPVYYSPLCKRVYQKTPNLHDGVDLFAQIAPAPDFQMICRIVGFDMIYYYARHILGRHR